MKIIPDKKLFWFLKRGVKLNLSEPSVSVLDMCIQQVLTRGRAEDVRDLLKNVDVPQFKEAFQRLKNFLPQDVKNFWENVLESYQ